MNLAHDVVTSTDEDVDTPTETATTLHGRRLILVRIVWGLLVILTVGIFVAALPVYVGQLRTLCVGVPCDAPSLSAAQAQNLWRTFGLSPDLYALSNGAFTALFELVCFTLGCVIYWRKSTDWLALLVALLVVMLGTTGVTMAVEGSQSVLQPVAVIWNFLTFGLFFLVFTLFPTGRFVPRWAVGLVVGDVMLGGSLLILFPNGSNPTSSPHPPVLKTLYFLVTWFGLNGALLLVQVYRYWKVSSAVERLQTKWVFFGGIAAVGEIIVIYVPLLLFPSLNQPGSLYPVITSFVTTLFLLFFVLSLGLAILRYRLWDIDILINRTLVYGALTAGIVALYILVVGYLGSLFRTSNNLLISLVATGLVAVLFQPGREWLQRGVNRLMYGLRDEPYRVISRLGQRLEAALAPDAVLPAIVETVAQALKLPYAAILLRQGEASTTAATYGTPGGHLIKLPLVYQTEPIGEFVLAPRSPGEEFSPADRAILSDLARQAGIAAHAVRLTADLQQLADELQASRLRLITTLEEERRRLRRDLHDGLGSALTSVTFQLDAASNLLERDPQAVKTLLRELKDQMQGSIADIRRLVYNLRPPILDEWGLVPAVREQVAQYQLNQVQVIVAAPEALPPLSAALEVAAYRIALEALSNVIRHAQATTCTIRFDLENEALIIEVLDDGKGLPGDLHAGVGINAMRERAAELGGTFRIERHAGWGGTRVVASLPLAKE